MTRRPQASRLALGWGALWGTALAFWLLAPRLLRYYRVWPSAPSEWLAVELALLVTFAVLGALLSFLGCVALVAAQGARRREFEDPSWAYALAVPPLLVVTYTVTALGIELASPGLRDLRPYAQAMRPLAAPLALSIVVAVFTYRFADRLPPVRTLARTLAAAAFLGAAALPLRVDSPAPAPAEPPALERLGESGGPRAPLLFVGIDGANWRTLRPLIEQGSLPTFARLAAEGLSGEVEAVWPPHWSSPAWAAIVTGHPREETGVFEDLAASAPGIPEFQVPLILDFALDPITAVEFLLVQAGAIRLAPPTRRLLRRAPFWELASRAGVRTAVVRFGFTFPATGRADFVISDWVGVEDWQLLGVAVDHRTDLAHPREEESELLAPFDADPAPGAERITALLPDPGTTQARGTIVDPVKMLHIEAAIDLRTLAASEGLLRSHPEVELLAVYLGGLDGVSHAFWPYRFPEDFPENPPTADEVARFGGVIDRYLEFLDQGLARLAAAFPREPRIVVVADHGYEAIHTMALWRGWHSARGAIFLAGGPGIPHREKRLDVSYLDVVPTVMELLGFATPPGAGGGSVLRRSSSIPKASPENGGAPKRATG